MAVKVDISRVCTIIRNGGGATLQSLIDRVFIGVQRLNTAIDLELSGVDCKYKINYNSGMRNYNKRKRAFTLAEVLITLGIIGVVAALTIPTLITNYQKKVFKTQLLKKYAEVSQSVLFAKNQTNVNFKSYCTKYDGSSYYNETECKAMFDTYFKVVGTCNYKDDVLTYNKQTSAYVDSGVWTKPSKLLSDGSCYDIRVNSGKLGFTFDINGPEKGPNALGHDLFSFYMDQNDYLQPIKQSATYSDDEIQSAIEDFENKYTGLELAACKASAEQKGAPCNKNSKQLGNGLGCSWFALHDVCPDDSTQGYWDCLPK